jgi:glutaminyl-peptide cyclotransferase
MAVVIATVMIGSCKEETERSVQTPTAPEKPAVQLKATPPFSGDQAYNYVQQQVDFGPRVPNSAAHQACASWLVETLQSHGLETSVQRATVQSYNGIDLNISNIMGRYKPDAQERILLCAHWDTRPYADRDSEQRNKPIDGANDGGSGVGVLLELARALGSAETAPGIGVDIVFFDAEDYGKPESAMSGSGNDSWCLGSQYWSANLPIAGYAPRYAILLDMVGASNAVFPKEGASVYYAKDVVEKVWGIGQAMGHKDYFANISGNPITDDHIYLNTVAGIPTIDIIHYEMARLDFGDFHHTHRDNMDIIDAGSLQVVGEVLLQVIYQE